MRKPRARTPYRGVGSGALWRPFVFIAVVMAMGPLAYAAGVGVDKHNLPIGDYKYSTTQGKRGFIYLCDAHADPGGGGAFADGPWIHEDGTWDSTEKAEVDGSVTWPQASVSIKRSGSHRTIISNDLPTDHTTGTFPIAASDDAYNYDHNPNSIAAKSVDITLPAHPKKGSPQCMQNEVGIAKDGVKILDGFDAQLRDAAAHEVQDHCDGHPNPSGYHYHTIPPCLYAGASKRKQSPLVGYAYDGFPIYGPRGRNGKRLTNADLDVCHGTTSKVKFNGKRQRIYHYVATREFPYTVGCFRGTEVVSPQH